jgi:hypothetical protein
MRFALVAFVCIRLLPGAPQPFVRASIDSPRPIIAGQAVRLNVTVLVPNYFTGAPDFPEINIDNAIVVSPSETPQHSVETIGGQSFAGITVTYSIYPQQPGTYLFTGCDRSRNVAGIEYAKALGDLAASSGERNHRPSSLRTEGIEESQFPCIRRSG